MTDGLRKSHLRKAPQVDLSEVGLPEGNHCDLLKILNRYGIFWVPLGESSCPDGSEYVWQRGIGGV